MEIICSFSRLMQLAYELGEARKSGDKKQIIEAKIKHDEYVKFCLEYADKMILPIKSGEL